MRDRWARLTSYIQTLGCRVYPGHSLAPRTPPSKRPAALVPVLPSSGPVEGCERQAVGRYRLTRCQLLRVPIPSRSGTRRRVTSVGATTTTSHLAAQSPSMAGLREVSVVCLDRFD